MKTDRNKSIISIVIIALSCFVVSLPFVAKPLAKYTVTTHNFYVGFQPENDFGMIATSQSQMPLLTTSSLLPSTTSVQEADDDSDEPDEVDDGSIKLVKGAENSVDGAARYDFTVYSFSSIPYEYSICVRNVPTAFTFKLYKNISSDILSEKWEEVGTAYSDGSMPIIRFHNNDMMFDGTSYDECKYMLVISSEIGVPTGKYTLSVETLFSQVLQDDSGKEVGI